MLTIFYLLFSFFALLLEPVSAGEQPNDITVASIDATDSLLPLAAESTGYVLYTEELLAGTQVSGSCRSELLRSIKCDDYTRTFQTAQYRSSLNQTLSTSVCDLNCRVSLERWFKGVERTCAGQLVYGAPATKFGGYIWAGWNETCLRDPQTNLLCNGTINNPFTTHKSISDILMKTSLTNFPM